MLQVSIFQTLPNNLFRVDFSLLLVGVMAIADEVDSQLAQAEKRAPYRTSQPLLPVSGGLSQDIKQQGQERESESVRAEAQTNLAGL
jgi:hypothetical protein